MAKKIELTGQTFERLTVLRQGPNLHGGVAWVCSCRCGKDILVTGNHLRRGAVKSCGCLKKEPIPFESQHRTHGMSRTPTYKTWQSMHQRCSNPESDQFPSYGGRGISVCEEWASFEQFFADMGPRPKGTTIDRKDANGIYEPGNCRWASPREQANNRRSSVRIDFLGQHLTVSQLATAFGISVPGTWHRLRAKFEKHPDGVYRLRPAGPRQSEQAQAEKEHAQH